MKKILTKPTPHQIELSKHAINMTIDAIDQKIQAAKIMGLIITDQIIAEILSDFKKEVEMYESTL
jgi:pseudouridine-5'-phosphate glycosidase